MTPSDVTPPATGAWRASFRRWRRTRPFWGALWVMVAGVVVATASLTTIALVVPGAGGRGGAQFIGGFLVVLGLLTLLLPGYRGMLGILAVILSLVSLLAANLGGLLVGMLLGILGGSMTLAWGVKPTKPVRSDS